MSIGLDIPRIDGLDKLSGRAQYVDDIAMPGLWHGGTIRSSIPRGRIKQIHFDPAINWSEFAVVDHRDIPNNQIKLIELDQPALAAHEIRHKHEPILLIAHRSPGKLREALRAIRIDYDPLPALFDPRAALSDPRQPLTPDFIQHNSDNVFKRIDIRKGDPAPFFANAHAGSVAALYTTSPPADPRSVAAPSATSGDKTGFVANAQIIQAEYRTGSQEHVYIETNGMLAYSDAGRLVVKGSMQCPYYVLDALTHAFARPPEAFRVIQTPVGGGFGGKEDFPSNLAVHTAALALKANAPVKIIYDRQEDMAATTKRHPSIVRHRTAVAPDGRLLAMEIDILMDGGAYVTLSPVVLSRGAIHAAGPYHCDNVHIHAEAKLTNSPPNGAFRGFGAPQTLFALECHMDLIARTLKIDPAELRRRNLLHHGQSTATGQLVREGTDLHGLLDKALMLADYEGCPQKQWDGRLCPSELNSCLARSNSSGALLSPLISSNDTLSPSDPPSKPLDTKQVGDTTDAPPYLRRGIGIATFHHGTGFTGSGETYLASKVQVEALPDGTVEVQTAQTDMGQGTTTILTQIAADRLGLRLDQVRIATPDTSRVPNSGPTVASRTAMVVGRLIEQACDDVVANLSKTEQAHVANLGEYPADILENDLAHNLLPPIIRAQAESPHNKAALQTPNSKLQTQIRAWHAANPCEKLVGRAQYTKPPSIQWDDATYCGDAYADFSWAAYIAEVEIDLRTYAVRVTDFVAAQEVGKVLNPTLARGQVQGGVAQGIGWALYENIVTEDGAMKNCQMTNYIIPASGDLPPIRVHFEENASPFGPRGAKGIGELPIDGPAPAIINAVCNALGIDITEIPLTPERLMAILDQKRQ